MAGGSGQRIPQAAVRISNSLFCCLNRHNSAIRCTFQSCRYFHRSEKQQEELFPRRLTLPENRGYVPMLSPHQVTAILTQLEASVPGNGPVRSFDSNLLPANSPTEDRRAAGQLVQTGGGLFGVFDGHGGSACAQAVSERLFSYIALSMLPSAVFEQYAHLMRSERPMELVNKHRFREDYVSDDLVYVFMQSLQRYVTETLSFSGDDPSFATSIVDQLTTAFLRLDYDISQEASPVSGTLDADLLEVAMSGACACVAHVKDLDIDVASVGDCRAIIGRLGADKKWTALPLTVDQNSENDAELRRVLESHPRSEWPTVVKNDRLLGLLVPLRAFGDVRFKWSRSDLQLLTSAINVLRTQTLIPPNFLTPPYLTAEPEVSHHTLRRQDRFMVIASDGLWETMSSQEAVEIIGDHLIGKESYKRDMEKPYQSLTLGKIAQILHERHRGLAHKTTDNNGATHLIRHALGFEHRKVSEMLTFPPAVARHYRDDMTVIIVYFNAEYLEEHCST